MALHEIVLPETKPETEWLGGRATQKVSPTYPHARLQTLMAIELTLWAEATDLGRVGTEWRFRIAPPAQIVRPLVPDVSFLSYEAIAKDAPPEAFSVPLGAPTVAVEILSPDDKPRLVREKIATYLSAGTSCVIAINPAKATFEVHDQADPRVLKAGDVFAHPALPGFTLDIKALFERAAR